MKKHTIHYTLVTSAILDGKKVVTNTEGLTGSIVADEGADLQSELAAINGVLKDQIVVSSASTTEI